MSPAGRGPVLINARAASRPELSGVERYARELIARLPALRPDVYRVVRPRPRLVHRAGHAWEQAALPALAARAGAALVYSPANLAPVAWPRSVVAIHDAAGLRHPEWYSRAYVAWQRTVLPLIARRALRVIAISNFSRGELVDLLGVAPDRVVVVPAGVDPRFSPAVDPDPARRALGLDRPYVLTVGSLIARKNLAALAPAARRLAADGVEVVAAGGGRPQLRAEGAVDGVRMLGYVEDRHLPGLYAGARAFVLASYYEGFGLPCLEAMGAGVPVVAADRSALPETCGDAALLVDPAAPDAVADALVTAVGDEARRATLIERGRARAAELTWDRTAAAVDAVLRAAAGT